MRFGALKSETPSAIYVNQGTFHVTERPDAVLSTILGSCVATCMRDPVLGIGGMNHFLLPDENPSLKENLVYGAYSMELLINGLLKLGAKKSRLEAKLFGGARMLAGVTDIGKFNGEFAEEFLENEGIPCVAKSLGGNMARRVKFYPASGRARQMFVKANEVDEATIRPQKKVAAPPPDAGSDLELF